MYAVSVIFPLFSPTPAFYLTLCDIFPLYVFFRRYTRIFVVYLTTSFQLKKMCVGSNRIRLSMDDELVKSWKEMDMAYFNVLLRDLTGVNGKTM